MSHRHTRESVRAVALAEGIFALQQLLLAGPDRLCPRYDVGAELVCTG